MIHDIKIWPQYFERVREGSKTFEIRENDRCYQAGDTVILSEFDPSKKTVCEPLGAYTGEREEFTIGFVMPVDEKRVVFSLLKQVPKIPSVFP